MYDQGLCEGTFVSLVLGPELATTGPGAGKAPKGPSLRYDLEVVMVNASPNIFKDIDLNGDAKLSKDEVSKYFEQGSNSEPEGMFEGEDRDSDGFISWKEFSVRTWGISASVLDSDTCAVGTKGQQPASYVPLALSSQPEDGPSSCQR